MDKKDDTKNKRRDSETTEECTRKEKQGIGSDTSEEDTLIE